MVTYVLPKIKYSSKQRRCSFSVSGWHPTGGTSHLASYFYL